MKKLLFKLIGFLLLVWALFAAVVYAFPKYLYNDEYGLYANTKAQLSEAHDVIIIGDSRAQAGVLAGRFDSDVYSLTLPGGTAVEGYYVLDEYLKHNSAPEAVILSYAPYHFELGETFWERAVKLDFLSFCQSFEVVRESARLKDDIAWRGNDGNDGFLEYGELLLYKLKYPPYYMADVSSGLSQGKINAARYAWVTKEVKRGKGHFYFGRAKQAEGPNSETARTDFEGSDLIETYFDRLLTRCEDEGIEVYFFTAPMSEKTEQAMHADFISGYQAMMERVQETHPHAVIETDITYLPNDCFGDESHLNEKGAKWFTEYIKQQTEIE